MALALSRPSCTAIELPFEVGNESRDEYVQQKTKPDEPGEICEDTISPELTASCTSPHAPVRNMYQQPSTFIYLGLLGYPGLAISKDTDSQVLVRMTSSTDTNKPNKIAKITATHHNPRIFLGPLILSVTSRKCLGAFIALTLFLPLSSTESLLWPFLGRSGHSLLFLSHLFRLGHFGLFLAGFLFGHSYRG